MRKSALCVIVLLAISLMAGCASSSKSEKGLVIGGATGAAVGAAIGAQAGNTAAGAIIGAMIGGTAGAIIGDYMDKQAAEIDEDLEGARVERIGEGIKITFESGILFDINSSALRGVAKDNLTQLATILNKYNDTEVLVEGHTDSTGGSEHNLDLSIRRAQSVANYMTGLNVQSNRFRIMGYGEEQPIESNDTAAGRQANRRVEIAIYANEKLKNAARTKVDG